MEFLREATLASSSPLHHRVDAANEWRYLAQQYGHPSELEAARGTLILLDLAVAESASLQHHSHRLTKNKVYKGARGVASAAAVLAVRAGDVPLAVSLLEQGRSTIFTQLGHYRSAIEDVRDVSPDLAKRFEELSASLNALLLNGDDNSETVTRLGKYRDIASR